METLPVDNPRKEAKNPAVEGSVPGSRWTGATLVCFGPTEDGDLKEMYCPTAGTCHYIGAGAQLLSPSCRAGVMGEPNPQVLPGIQMPQQTPLNGFGYTEKTCLKPIKEHEL